MKRIPFRYDTIFMYGSLQSVGHTVEYFAKNTKKLVIFIVMPRLSRVSNELWIYKNGIIQKKLLLATSSNLILYYVYWLYFHTKILFTYFSRSEKIIALVSHPVALFGMSIMKIFRHVDYAYWIGDYYPPVHWSLILFEKLKKYYHDRIPYIYYLSDRMNSIYNSKVITIPNKRTVMWGMKLYSGPKKTITSPLRLLFVGAIRPSQGIENLLLFIKNTPKVQLSIVGVCEAALYKAYIKSIKEYKISDRVWFPNTFVSDKELSKLSRHHHVGIALYEKGMQSATYYTDPGKVKTYIELGLPIVMTNTSAIAPYIKKYMAGGLVDELEELPVALERIKRRYNVYQRGIHAFAHYFEFEKYYRQAFVCLEKHI